MAGQQPVAARIKFSWLCDRLQAIEGATRGARVQRDDPKLDKLRALFDEVKREGGGQRTDVYAFIRLILPEEDKARQYGMKEVTLGELYARVLQADAETNRRIKEWKAPGKGHHDMLRGDMADVLSTALQGRCPHSAGLSVLAVNELLDELSKAHSADKDSRVKVLSAAVQKLDAREHKWLIRIVLRYMRLGVGLHKVLDAYHPAASRAFGESANLEQVCRECTVPGFTHDGGGLSVFTPACAMLASKARIADAARRLGDKGFYVEDKLDGERVMLHLERKPGEEPKLQFWTRNRKDFTKNYAAAMAGVVSRAVLPSVRSCILDGEMMAWDAQLGRHLEFGQFRGSLASVQAPDVYNSYFVRAAREARRVWEGATRAPSAPCRPELNRRAARSSPLARHSTCCCSTGRT